MKRLTTLLAAAVLASIHTLAGQQAAPIPSEPLKFGGFSARFGGDGTFALEGPGWPAFKGTWKRDGAEIELLTAGGAAGGCHKAGPYPAPVGKGHPTPALRLDPCPPQP